MIGELGNHLWQSTVFAVVAGLLTLAFRRHRAHIRYWLWFCASIKLLVPFAFLLGIGSQLQWAPAARKAVVQMTASNIPAAVEQIVEPFIEFGPSPRSAQPRFSSLTLTLMAIWSVGFVCIVAIRLRGWLKIRRALGASRLMNLPTPVDVRCCPGLLEPGVVGWIRPLLLLPEGIEDRLTAQQLAAVLAHELCHVRRRDNLFASIHMAVEALFWFHPLVWWIGARLIEERERACDEEVLRLGNEPRDYAEGILNVCKNYVESPLVCVSGVTGSDLKKRIESIMANRLVKNMGPARRVALAAVAIIALAAPVVIGMLSTRSVRAQSHPKFEVASIRPTKSCGGLDGGGRGGARAGGGGGGKKTDGGPARGGTPGRITACGTVESLIRTSHIVFANGQPSRLAYGNATPIQGGPDWARSDLYQINARAEGTPTQEMMRGPMLQALLEDRFQLKLHRETRESAAYVLTVAKGGQKLEPFKEGSCVPMSFPPVPVPEGQTRCIDLDFEQMEKTTAFGLHRHGMAFEELPTWLFVMTDRPVVDKTGITGRYNMRLEFTPDESTPNAMMQIMANRMNGDTSPPPAPEPGALTLFTAIQQQLGLKLEPTKAPRDYIVIDSVQRPTGN